MKIEKLSYFIDLYENRSYTKTAQKNFISQTSVTQFINSLEAEFGVVLFDRSTLPIRPTKVGTVFYNEAKILLQQYRRMEMAATSEIKNITRPIRVYYTSKIDLQLLLPFVMHFKKAHPDIVLEFSSSTLKENETYLFSSHCDAAIGVNMWPREDVKSVTLYKGQYQAIVGKHHDLYGQKSITTEMLYHYPLIMLSQNVLGKYYDTIMDNIRLDGYYPNIQKTVDDIQTELFSVATDNYIGIVPDVYNLEDYENIVQKIPILNTNHQFKLEMCYFSGRNPSMDLFAKKFECYLKRQ